MVLLDRADPACRRNLVFRRCVTLFVASKPASRLCRRPDVFLDRILVAHHGYRSRMVCPCVLHGDLFRDLGVVLRLAAATRRQGAISWRKQMASNAHAGSKHGCSATIAMDKIDEQPSTGFHPRSGMDHAGMVALSAIGPERSEIARVGPRELRIRCSKHGCPRSCVSLYAFGQFRNRVSMVVDVDSQSL